MIVLATLNAKYIHSAFGLRYLLANMGELKGATQLLEFDINHRPLEIAEKILSFSPRIIGLGVYIWNASQSLDLVKLLKKLAPQTKIILGGPEVSYESESQEIVKCADHVITGEADLEFAIVCHKILKDRAALADKIIRAELPALEKLSLPYAHYTDDDIKNRVLYVEASRGCPFTCEFCLSSLDIPVRQFALVNFLKEMEGLLARGAKHFKFVDRTFNLNLPTSRAILDFFYARYFDGLFLHFEMIPDRLPEALRESIKRFPPGVLQFEVGIQSFNPEVSKLISRRQDLEKLSRNLAFLREESGVHVHADLIVGLPGEDLKSFAEGFDRLVALGPQEIQVGMLKRLRGTPIIRHDQEWEMIYSPLPPYEILSNKLIDFPTMQRLRRFSRYWDLYANSGNFSSVLHELWSEASPFYRFLEFSDWLFQKTRRTHSLSRHTLESCLSEYMQEILGFSAEQINSKLEHANSIRKVAANSGLPERQTKHLSVKNALFCHSEGKN